jgi:hypothetical protein
MEALVMWGNPNTTDPPTPDIVEKLYVLASASEVAGTRPQIAAVAREAAEAIRKLRRRIESLELRLKMLRRAGREHSG